MGERVRDAAERLRILQANARPMKRTPGLTRVNLTGNIMGGRLVDPELGGPYLRTVWFTFFGIPLFLVGIYLVSHPLDKRGVIEKDRFYFHQKVSMTGVRAAYGDGAVRGMVLHSAGIFLAWVLGIAAVFTGLAIWGAYSKNS